MPPPFFGKTYFQGKRLSLRAVILQICFSRTYCCACDGLSWHVRFSRKYWCASVAFCKAVFRVHTVVPAPLVLHIRLSRTYFCARTFHFASEFFRKTLSCLRLFLALQVRFSRTCYCACAIWFRKSVLEKILLCLRVFFNPPFDTILICLRRFFFCKSSFREDPVVPATSSF